MEWASKSNRKLLVMSITFVLLLIQSVYLEKIVVILVHREL